MLHQVQELLTQMENQYLGIGGIERAQMCQLHLRAMVLRTLIVLQNDANGSDTNKQSSCSQLLLVLDKVDR